jgi:dipeptidyl aminopeptidase/acylaminoacyl peptidase
LFSNEKQVTEKTPPAFITHAKTDVVVSVDNSRNYYAALKAHKVPAELLEFPEGNHGYNGYKGKEWDAWQKRSLEWLAEQGIVKEKK